MTLENARLKPDTVKSDSGAAQRSVDMYHAEIIFISANVKGGFCPEHTRFPKSQYGGSDRLHSDGCRSRRARGCGPGETLPHRLRRLPLPRPAPCRAPRGRADRASRSLSEAVASDSALAKSPALQVGGGERAADRIPPGWAGPCSRRTLPPAGRRPCGSGRWRVRVLPSAMARRPSSTATRDLLFGLVADALRSLPSSTRAPAASPFCRKRLAAAIGVIGAELVVVARAGRRARASGRARSARAPHRCAASDRSAASRRLPDRPSSRARHSAAQARHRRTSSRRRDRRRDCARSTSAAWKSLDHGRARIAAPATQLVSAAIACAFTTAAS